MAKQAGAKVWSELEGPGESSEELSTDTEGDQAREEVQWVPVGSE